MPRIYTRTGDKGTTSLIYGIRVPKNDSRVEAYGTCDEANSMIGLAVSFLRKEQFDQKDELLKIFHQIQTLIFHVGSELSTPEGKEVYWSIEEKHVKELESWIDMLEEQTPELKQFILPGGHPAGAALHSSRTIVRRAERCTVSIEKVNPIVVAYLNRLSDFLFVAARFINYKIGIEEQILHD